MSTQERCDYCLIPGRRKDVLTLKEMFHASPRTTKIISDKLKKDINCNVEEHICHFCWLRVRRSLGVLGVPKDTRSGMDVLNDIYGNGKGKRECPNDSDDGGKLRYHFFKAMQAVRMPCELCTALGEYTLTRTYCPTCPHAPSLCSSCFDMYHERYD